MPSEDLYASNTAFNEYELEQALISIAKHKTKIDASPPVEAQFTSNLPPPVYFITYYFTKEGKAESYVTPGMSSLEALESEFQDLKHWMLTAGDELTQAAILGYKHSPFGVVAFQPLPDYHYSHAPKKTKKVYVNGKNKDLSKLGKHYVNSNNFKQEA